MTMQTPVKALLLLLLSVVGLVVHPLGTGQSAAQASPPAQAAASIHVALGAPTRAGGDELVLTRSQYVIGYSRVMNGPRWASWRLVASDFGGQARHKGHFITDGSLPAGWYQAQHSDYTGSGYDRGHLVRSEDRTASRADNDSTFLMTNVAPQRHDLNAGPWLRLEDHCRVLAQHDGRQLFITAGVIYGSAPARIGGGVAVPESWWKVVVVTAPGDGAAEVTPQTRVIAVVMPNVEGIGDRPWTGYRTTVAEVERRTGYTLLDNVEGSVRAVLLVQR